MAGELLIQFFAQYGEPISYAVIAFVVWRAGSKVQRFLDRNEQMHKDHYANHEKLKSEVQDIKRYGLN